MTPLSVDPEGLFEPSADYALGIADGPLLPGAVRRRLTPETAREAITGEPGRFALVYSDVAPTGQRFAADLVLLGLAEQIPIVSVQRGRLREDDGELRWEEFPAGRLGSLFAHASGIRLPALIGERGVVSNDPYRTIALLRNETPAPPVDLYPAELQDLQRRWTARIFFDLHAAVYRAGFLTDQAEYEGEVDRVERLLGDLDARFASEDFLVGEALTDADVWLFGLLIRFDQVYAPSFRLHRYRIRDFPALHRYVQRLYAVPALHATTDFDAISRGYHLGIPALNRGILPRGPRDLFLRDALRSTV